VCWYFTTYLLKMIENLQDGRVRAMLIAKAMLVGVKEAVGVPNALNPSGHYSRPHFTDNLEKGDWADFVEIMDPGFLREQGHEAVLPPSPNMLMAPHDRKKVEDHASCGRAPIFLQLPAF
jgi:hypothetical protein